MEPETRPNVKELEAIPREPARWVLLRCAGPLAFMLSVIPWPIDASLMSPRVVGWWFIFWSTVGLIATFQSGRATMGSRITTCLLNFPILIFGYAIGPYSL